MNLEVGMYCYNKINRKSGIGKIVGFRENNNAVIEYKSGVVLTSIGNIVASYRLINLIEKGDYVNGYLVNFVYKPNGEEVFRIEIERDTLKGHIITKSENIKSIVTKEQFNSMKYVVGE